MTIHQNSSKITTNHLKRKAIVYLRQSTERQVQHNQESKRLQYALANHAQDLGWKEIDVIDTDLGASAGIGAGERAGFDRLLAAVAKGEVGIVLSREVSRLSRTDKDWCRLLEVCQIFDTLICDEEQVYDLSLLGDQLVLGIKGTLSVVELKTIQMRMLAGKEAKALRGELYSMLPPGYIIDPLGKVVKDPDVRIQEAISLIFRKFRELWSVRKTFLWFREQGIELPIHSCHGAKRKIEWQLPSHSFIGYVLGHAFYAGAYVWGRQETYKVVENGTVKKRHRKICRQEDCKVFIPNHHEGYIDWEAFKENERIIASNKVRSEKNDSIGAIRSGQGLLCGLLRCGCCGRKLHIRYWGRRGTSPSYMCVGTNNTGSNVCLSFGGRKVEQRFSQELLKTLSPYGVKASLMAIERLKSGHDEKIKALNRQLEQIQYEAERVFEQYNSVDPRHRLVADELERRWNEKLEQVEKLKLSLNTITQQSCPLSEKDHKRISQLGENFQQVWKSCTFETKKKIVRTVVEDVIATLDSAKQMLHFIIHWKGGTHTHFEMERPRSATSQKTSLEDIEIIRKMGVRYGDGEIARVLNKLGHPTGKGNQWTAQRVQSMRYKYSISGQTKTKPDPEILTLNQAAKYCNVSQLTIKRLVSSGVLKKNQVVPWAPWEIRRSDLDSEAVRSIFDRLHKTGKLIIEGDNSITSELLF